MRESTDFEHNVYRHPERWGLPTVRFQPIHDVYALGVVLLEIGLWRRASSVLRSHSPGAVRERFIEYATNRLPYLTGTAYSNIVKTWLEGRRIVSNTATEPGSLAEGFYKYVVEPLETLSRSLQVVDTAGAAIVVDLAD